MEQKSKEFRERIFKVISGYDESTSISIIESFQHDILKAIEFCNTENTEIIEKEKEDSLIKESLLEIFNKYNDESSGDIEAEGIERFLNDIGVDPMGILSLIIAWKLKAKVMCRFTKEEFIKGFSKLNFNSLESIIEGVPILEEELDSPLFIDFYKFVFEFGKEHPAHRNIQLDVATALLNIILKKKFPLILNDFIIFLTNQEPSKTTINIDTWMLIYEFFQQYPTKLSFESYSEDECWPILIDKFVQQFV